MKAKLIKKPKVGIDQSMEGEPVDGPVDQAWREAMAKLMASEEKSFPGHKGRPGEQGGSVPRSGAEVTDAEPDTTKANNAKRLKVINGEATFSWGQVNAVLSKHIPATRILAIHHAMVAKRRTNLKYSDVKTGILKGYPYSGKAQLDLNKYLLEGLTELI